MANRHIRMLNGDASLRQHISIVPTQMVENINGRFAADIAAMRNSTWLVLQAISKLNRPRATEIREITDLAISTILKCGLDLRNKNLVVSHPLPGTEGRSNPTLLFSLAPGVTADWIAAEVKRLNLPILQESSKRQEKENKDKKSEKQKISTSSKVQLEVKSNKSIVYEYIKRPGGCTANEIIEKSGLTPGIVQSTLSRFRRDGEADRTRNQDKATVEYIYTAASGTSNSEQAHDVSDEVTPAIHFSETNLSLGQENIPILTPMKSMQQELSSPSSTNDDNDAQGTIWEAVGLMAQRIFDLEKRFMKIEQALQGDGNVKAEEILSLLRQKA